MFLCHLYTDRFPLDYIYRQTVNQFSTSLHYILKSLQKSQNRHQILLVIYYINHFNSNYISLIKLQYYMYIFFVLFMFSCLSLCILLYNLYSYAYIIWNPGDQHETLYELGFVAPCILINQSLYSAKSIHHLHCTYYGAVFIVKSQLIAAKERLT